ncbi:PREDICTED: light-harvesting complex-like protein OHP2, chloroplastic [Lupinus angustifolius]|uniref:light-harvesting complex-like protein OHP2, chloroplastic n=1 Tax=Lupinus angustifolius TaxID=3871 RepID=UPI00092F5CF6|nr:PREDICTED: light-harvesting complex-like protein OHP2, chloroplastic [Lupinus angustifolius]XP_019435033.1 PREDICTED: light-harvesting complex-like protein OHP2, chloroplastic [Lupinus angustifolius]XP_019435034.1 PREDICTED: light-harvesting complex-like protein OHP2, chloroplastic [Lupinus angustifolius]
MSMASSIPCIKIPTSPSSPSTSSYSFRFSSFKIHSVTIRNSKAEGPIRRPVAPPVREPSLKPIPPTTVGPTLQNSASVVVGDDKNVITLEFQRQKAKELQEYFKQKKLDEAASQSPLFGFIGKNEISNGRWAMFGFAVGLLTEYATGSDFVDQVKILFSNFGILDLE